MMGSDFAAVRSFDGLIALALECIRQPEANVRIVFDNEDFLFHESLPFSGGGWFGMQRVKMLAAAGTVLAPDIAAVIPGDPPGKR